MVKRRDRHGRGLRGPVMPGARTPGYVSRPEAFVDAVQDAVSRVQRSCPEALGGIDIGIEDVPRGPSSNGGVPLAVAIEAVGSYPARIVIFRRPLEHRSATRRGLRILVHRTLVEQLSAVTGHSVHDIDPHVDLDDDY